jgi:hypothetical protein
MGGAKAATTIQSTSLERYTRFTFDVTALKSLEARVKSHLYLYVVPPLRGTIVYKSFDVH